jgi:hypothetical protein
MLNLGMKALKGRIIPSQRMKVTFGNRNHPREKSACGLNIEIHHPRWTAGGFDYRRSLVFESKGPCTTYCVQLFQFDLRGKQGLYEIIPYMKTTRSSDLFQKAPH